MLGEPKRYRLIYARGTGRPSWYIYGTADAMAEAQRAYEETGIPIAVVEASEDGRVCNHITTIGGQRRRRRR